MLTNAAFPYFECLNLGFFQATTKFPHGQRSEEIQDRCHQRSPRPDPQFHQVRSLFLIKLFYSARFWKVGNGRKNMCENSDHYSTGWVDQYIVVTSFFKSPCGLKLQLWRSLLFSPTLSNFCGLIYKFACSTMSPSGDIHRAFHIILQISWPIFIIFGTR